MNPRHFHMIATRTEVEEERLRSQFQVLISPFSELNIISPSRNAPDMPLNPVEVQHRLCPVCSNVSTVGSCQVCGNPNIKRGDDDKSSSCYDKKCDFKEKIKLEDKSGGKRKKKSKSSNKKSTKKSEKNRDKAPSPTDCDFPDEEKHLVEFSSRIQIESPMTPSAARKSLLQRVTDDASPKSTKKKLTSTRSKTSAESKISIQSPRNTFSKIRSGDPRPSIDENEGRNSPCRGVLSPIRMSFRNKIKFTPDDLYMNEANESSDEIDVHDKAFPSLPVSSTEDGVIRNTVENAASTSISAAIGEDEKDSNREEAANDETSQEVKPPKKSSSCVRLSSFLAWSEEERGRPWKCRICTYLNQNPLHLSCEVCCALREKEKPSDEVSLLSLSTEARESSVMLPEHQQKAIRSKAKKVEEQWFEDLEAHRMAELVEYQRQVLERYQSA
jgi:hypothetical protein